MKKHKSPYHGHRFPAHIIALAVRWYFRYQLSLRDIQEMLFERGVEVSHESIRRWCDKFGVHFARRIKAARPRLGSTWHLDEVRISLNGEPHWLWRTVDQDGNEIDVLVQRRRNKAAAKRFFRRILRSSGMTPQRIVTDQLQSYAAAVASMAQLAGVKHTFVKASARVNNRAENSHQPTRERERRMRGFKLVERTQAFLSNFGLIRQHFALKRHLMGANQYRKQLARRFSSWRAFTHTQTAPAMA